MFACCVCFTESHTPAPLCVAWEQHAEKVCPACVVTLKSYNHYCPICRAPLAGHVYPEPEEEIEVWNALHIAEDGTVTWEHDLGTT